MVVPKVPPVSKVSSGVVVAIGILTFVLSQTLTFWATGMGKSRPRTAETKADRDEVVEKDAHDWKMIERLLNSCLLF